MTKTRSNRFSKRRRGGRKTIKRRGGKRRSHRRRRSRVNRRRRSRVKHRSRVNRRSKVSRRRGRKHKKRGGERGDKGEPYTQSEFTAFVKDNSDQIYRIETTLEAGNGEEQEQIERSLYYINEDAHGSPAFEIIEIPGNPLSAEITSAPLEYLSWNELVGGPDTTLLDEDGRKKWYKIYRIIPTDWSAGGGQLLHFTSATTR